MRPPMEFNPSMASVLMALPRDKKRGTLTCQDIGKTVRLNNAHTTDWLTRLHGLGLVLLVGSRRSPMVGGTADPDAKWRLSANGLRVVNVLTGAV